MPDVSEAKASLLYTVSSGPVMVTQTLLQNQNTLSCISVTVWRCLQSVQALLPVPQSLAQCGLVCEVEPCGFNSVETELDPLLLASLLSLALAVVLLTCVKSQQCFSKLYCMWRGMGTISVVLLIIQLGVVACMSQNGKVKGSTV